jgi:hypothetical protein
MKLDMDAPSIASDGKSATIKGKLTAEYIFTMEKAPPVHRNGDDASFTLKKNNGIWVILDTN